MTFSVRVFEAFDQNAHRAKGFAFPNVKVRR